MIIATKGAHPHLHGSFGYLARNCARPKASSARDCEIVNSSLLKSSAEAGLRSP
jgi:hypothetical protein